MKRTAIAVLSVSLLLAAGCSREFPPDSDSSQIPVLFRVNDLPAVKGGQELTSSTISDFIVAASWTDTSDVTVPFMSGATATRSGSVWTTSPTYYYPVEGELSFYGYAPAAAAAGVSNFGQDAIGYYSLDYAPPTEVSDQYDFCLVEPVAGIARTDTAVAMKFRHATAQVLFKAKTADTLSASRKIYIDTISVKVAASRYLEFSTTAPYFNWGAVNGTASYEITTADGGLVSTPISEDIVKVSSDAGRMYLLPQYMTTGCTVTVSWRLWDTVKAKNIGTGKETLHLNAVTSQWESGKRYTYILEMAMGSWKFHTCECYFDEEIDDAIRGFSYECYFDEDLDGTIPGNVNGTYFTEESFD